MTDPVFLPDIWAALGGDAADIERLSVTGSGDLPAVFPVTDLAVAAIGAAGLAVAELIAAGGHPMPNVTVDRRLAAFWFGASIRPQGWDVPPAWDAIAGDYRAADGWIRLHTNAPAHRAAALSVLGTRAEKTAVADAVAAWAADDLEAAVIAAGGCAAAMRSAEAWAAHHQGRAVAAEPLLHQAAMGEGPIPDRAVPTDRPLTGIRVLDLTRVLAGPTATRFLAGFGAEVLRIDPPFWDEPSLAPEMTLGKVCAHLDLRRAEDLATLKRLMAGADVMVHGYRPAALAGYGLDAAARRALNPALIDVALDAYGWAGPWQGRRGFDSLVQMSSGIAEAGMRALGRNRPTPLPVQGLDMASGYLLAAAAFRGLTLRRRTGRGLEARASLARTAGLLMSRRQAEAAPLAPETPTDWGQTVEMTAWGPARRVTAPVVVSGAAMRWDRAAGPLGAVAAPQGWV
jgi:crotonobetainyl-CoA:carnitine CoA-transferase CaiB-like acyl-CoA transferase